MLTSSEVRDKISASYQLLQGSSISISTFEQVRILLKGIHPEVDRKLVACSRALARVQKVQVGDIITLSAEVLPEDTEEKKKRKKALLLFISSYKNLKSEIQRIESELAQASQSSEKSIDPQLRAWGRIVGFSKGPFGIITIAALIILATLTVMSVKRPQTQKSIHPSVRQGATLQVITYNGKQIPLSQLYVGTGPDCDSPHYHANNGKVTTLDGLVIPDPEGCGYGKLKDIRVTEVSISPTL